MRTQGEKPGHTDPGLHRPRVVDTHVHLWDPAQGYGWLRGELRRPFTVADLRETVAPCRRDAEVSVILVEADRGRGTDETVEHLELAGRDPLVVGVVADLPDAVDIGALLRLPGAENLVGIRTSTRRWRSLDRRDRLRIGATLAATGLAWELNVEPVDLVDVAELATAINDVPLVLDHLAGAPGAPGPHASAWTVWRDAVDHLAERPNAVVKVSGLATRDQHTVAAAVEHVIRRFDRTRTPIGSDWPVCTSRTAWRESIERSIGALGDAADSPASAIAARRAYPSLQLASS